MNARYLLAAGVITAASLITACERFPSGCYLMLREGERRPANWIYHPDTNTYWDGFPPGGLIGWATTRDGDVWLPTRTCADTHGAVR
jgi:hypothetical protein